MGLLSIFASIAGALLLTLCLGAIVFTAWFVSRSAQGVAVSNGENDPVNENVVVVCHFVPSGDVLVLYGEPNADPALELARLPGSETYPVLKLSDDYVMIPLDDATFGWAARNSGELRGDCEGVPRGDDEPLPCLFTNTIDVLLYQQADMVDLEGSLQPGTYPVLAVREGVYQLQVTDEQTGWVVQVGGTIAGECAALATPP